jgi:phosphoribosyl-AMP cyclohydrolase / phosphoribosyl-ATP pyrophosphohydrolase
MTRIGRAAELDALDFDKSGGVVPVIAQHAHTGEVLMLAYASRDALERTFAEGVMCYWSRSRGELWRKGDTSGSTQRVVALYADCDSDAVLAHVVPAGPACHTGAWTCFGGVPTLPALSAVIAERAATGEPAAGQPSYTQRLLGDANLRLKKLGEEAVELALACERREADRVAEEAADLIYHIMVACQAAGVDAATVLAALDARRPVSEVGAAPAGGGTARAE